MKEDGKTHLSIVCGDRVVDVNENPGLVTGVDAGDGDEGGGSAGSATGDLDLSAADVELCICNPSISFV